MANEIEIKLIAEQQQVKALTERHFEGVTSVDEWRTSELKNTYFDTAHFKLRELKIGLRIRVDNDRLIQTVKSSGKAIGGLHERNESEAELSDFKIDIDKVDDPYLKILLEEAVEDDGALEPVFTTNFVRQRTRLHYEDGSEIEVALDIGHIFYEDDSAPISEVELELITGNARHLFDLSRSLIMDSGFSISNASKARRGYALCSRLPVTHRRMSTIELSQGTGAETAFEVICYSGLKHWQYYEQFLDSSLAPEAILQMYRALLYIQHVYQTFGALIPRHATADLRANWLWMAEFMENIVEIAREREHLRKLVEQEVVSEQALQPAIDDNQKQLADAVNRFKNILSSPRYNLIMLGISEWLFFKQWRAFLSESEQSRLEQPIIDYALAQLEHMLRELKREIGPKVELDEEGYLAQVPRLRRALDVGLFFGGLFDSKQRQKYRQPWLDLLAGTREMAFNRFAAKCFRQYQLKTEPETELWLQKRTEAVLEAMEQTRKALFKARPYWLK